MRPSIMCSGRPCPRRLRVRERGLHQKIDSLIVEHVEMFAVDAGDAAMAVAHIFARQTSVIATIQGISF